MGVAYPPYYDFLPPYEYYNDPYYANYPTRSSSKRSYYEKDGRSNSKEGRERDDPKDRGDEKEKPFNDDFVSIKIHQFSPFKIFFVRTKTKLK